MIAVNAKKIVDLRMNGYRPNEMILVSLVGKIDELNHTIFADQRGDYEWNWCAGLDICIFARSGVEWTKTIKAIADVKPHLLAIWDIDRHEGAEFYKTLILGCSDKPQSHYKTKLDYMPWCSIQNKLFSGQLCN